MITNLIMELLFMIQKIKRKIIEEESSFILPAIALLMICVLALCGCSVIKKDSDKVSGLEYTVVENEDLPLELKKLIESKKENTIRLTYATKDYTYIVAGYGKQPTSGYSIRVNDVYVGTNAIYVDVDLLGPESGEQVTELPTTPYIVIKIEKREESVVFNM